MLCRLPGPRPPRFLGRSAARSRLNVGGTGTVTFSGTIGGAVSLNVADTGTGTAIVTSASNSNTYTGGTTISSGTLLVNGSIPGTTTVNSGGTLGGTGTVSAVVVNSGGIVNPGSGAGFGTLTAGSVDLSDGGNLAIAVGGATAGNYDELVVTGNLTLGGTSLLSLNLSGYSNAGSSSRTITPITAGSQTGTFSNASPTPPATSALVASANITNNPYAYGVSASYASSASIPLTLVQGAMPTVTVSDAGGTYNGSAFPATALVAGIVSGVDNTPASSLESVTPTLTYYAGTTATGTALSVGRAWPEPTPSWPTSPAARITWPRAAARSPSPSLKPRRRSPSAMPAEPTMVRRLSLPRPW